MTELVTITVSMDNVLKEFLDDYAWRKRKTRSLVVRELVEGLKDGVDDDAHDA